MRNKLLGQWLQYSWAACFFDDFSRWQELTKNQTVFPGPWKELLDKQEPEALQQEYDDLFKGVNADMKL